MTRKGFRKLLALVLALAIIAPVTATGCGGSSPEDAVRRYLNAWQDLDWEAFKESVAPQHRELTKEQDELGKMEFEQVKVVFDGLKMKTNYSKDDDKKAAVVLTDGKITITLSVIGEMKTETRNIKDMSEEEERTYPTVEVDGVWYVDKEL